MIPKGATVATALTDLLDSIAKCDRIHIEDTKKNRLTRIRLGMSVVDQENIVRNLRGRDFVTGPVADTNPLYPGMLWIFKVHYYHDILYVKVREVEYELDGSVCKALSCHIDNIAV